MGGSLVLLSVGRYTASMGRRNVWGEEGELTPVNNVLNRRVPIGHRAQSVRSDEVGHSC